MLGEGDFAELEQALNVERRYAAATDGLLAALRHSPTLEDSWSLVLQAFAELVAAKSGRLWRQVAGRLSPHVALGTSSVPTPAELTLTQALGVEAVDGLPLVWLVPAAHPLAQGLVEPDGQVSCLLLRNGDRLSAVLCLVLVSGRTLAPNEQRRLAALGEHVAAAIGDRLTREELLQSIRSRDEVLGIVAHDLRNPLNVITTASSMLQQRLTDQRVRRSVERILRAAQRAEHLIDELLDVSAIQSGHFAVEKRPFDAAAAVLAAIEMQQGLAASSSVILASDLAPGLPPIEADGERVLEVLENLVGNAIKFTPVGGTIIIGARAQDEELVLWVKDTGAGIPAEQIPHLFDRFWQAAKGDRRGAGLGLTICRAIVDAHDGRIWAESEPGVGSTVFFSLPAEGLTRSQVT